MIEVTVPTETTDSRLPPDEVPRVVKPRIPRHTHRPIIAIADDQILIERTGHIYPYSQLGPIIAAEPSSFIVAQGFGQLLHDLTGIFGKNGTAPNSLYQYRLTPRTPRVWQTRGQNQAVRASDSMVNFVGFQARQKNGKQHGGNGNATYHYALDPIEFNAQGIDDMYPGPETRINKLLTWATHIREWCKCNLIEVKPTAGGIAAQLLRDPRFYPEARRKVPQLINDICRTQLPGNYYRLIGDTARTYSRVLYLDMTSAHHAIAARTIFPDGDNLHAYGHWTRPQPYCRENADLLTQPGLFHLQLAIPHLPAHSFIPPFLERSGEQNCWVYSNELHFLKANGVHIKGIICALTSTGRDRGLNKYAKFALQEIRANPNYKPWLKPTLHAAYGLLAARPVPFETGYYQARGGESTEYLMGAHSHHVYAHRTPRTPESRIACVLHRGMIEAGLRSEVLELARTLTEAYGREIISVYADSLLIRDNKRDERGPVMPLLPAPWAIKAELTDVKFYSATHFVSNEIAKLPGFTKRGRPMPRELRSQMSRVRFHESRPDTLRDII